MLNNCFIYCTERHFPDIPLYLWLTLISYFCITISISAKNVTDQGDRGKRMRCVLSSWQSTARQHISMCGIMRSICTIKTLNQPPTQRSDEVHITAASSVINTTKKGAVVCNRHGHLLIRKSERVKESQLEREMGQTELGGKKSLKNEGLKSDCWRSSGAAYSQGTGLNREHYKKKNVSK